MNEKDKKEGTNNHIFGRHDKWQFYYIPTKTKNVVAMFIICRMESDNNKISLFICVNLNTKNSFQLITILFSVRFYSPKIF